MAGAELYQDVVTYCELGEHRSASEDDLETADWLYRSLHRVQIEAKRHPFELSQFLLSRHRLRLGDETLESFPLWPPCATDGSLSAAVRYVAESQVLPDLDGCAAMVEVASDGAHVLGHDDAQMLQRIAHAGPRAILAVTPHPSGELVALDPPADLEPWPCPIALIGARTRDRLVASANGAKIELETSGARERDAIAYNVVGSIPRGPRLIVVSASYSGWFRCAGEHGGSVAMWLALARWAQNRDSDTSFLFVACSGHELGALGMAHFMQHQAPASHQVASWLHLGSGIGTYAYTETADGLVKTNQASPLRPWCNDDGLATLLTAHFALRSQRGTPHGAEARMLIDGSPRVWTLEASSALDHLRQDLPEASTAPELLEPVGRRLVRVLETVESQ